VTDAPPRLLLSVGEAAAALGISRSTLYCEVAAGRLETVKIGARRLFVLEEVKRYVGQLRQEVGGDAR
jgi:excisionase family DNA binding protein